VFQHTHIEEHINVSSHRKMTTRKERGSEKGFVKQLQKSVEKTVRFVSTPEHRVRAFYSESNSHLRSPRARRRNYTWKKPKLTICKGGPSSPLSNEDKRACEMQALDQFT
jgi:hypothetical protein